ncbi:MAG: hypothetical protein IT445_10390 [Phycisphaeraceae bacterium]|nr:hypothetical protein [Phycisphaeraceae bacterium]
MPDEIEVYASLESPLYGGLLQVLETVSRAIEADAAAGRVYQCAELSMDTCVLLSRLGVDPRKEAALSDWPNQPGNLFDRLAKDRQPNGVSRPRDLFSEQDFADAGLFRPIETVHPITDCLCQCMELQGKSWALLCYLRAAPHLPFAEDQIALLRRLHPTVERTIRQSLRRQLHPNGSPETIQGLPLPRRLARLSKTERQILGYLRTAMTEKQIADELSRSHHTIHVHVKNIYRKFGISSRRELMEIFMER